MQIDKYLEFTKDKIISTETISGEGDLIINKVTTKYGNIMYWDMNSGKVISAEWKVPGIFEIRKLDEEALEKISGKYFLESYGERF